MSRLRSAANLSSFCQATIKRVNSINTLFITFAVFLTTFLTTFLAMSVFAPISSSDAATVTTNLDISGYYVSTTASDINMEIIANPTGKVVTAKDTVITKTNNPTGYKLYLSTANSSNTVIDGKTIPGNALFLDGDSTSGIFISPTAGTLSDPASLDPNSWGFSLTGNDADFAKVPLITSPDIIQTYSSANEDGVEREIWYGVKANMAAEAGTYSNTVVYSATADTSSVSGEELAISPNKTGSLDGKETVIIKTSLYANYNFATTDVSVTIGGKTCTVTAVGKDANLNTTTITCTTPALDAGTHDVVVSIPMYEVNLSLTGGYTVAPTFYTITQMQQMTPEICATATKPLTTAGTSEATIDTTGAHVGDTAYVAQSTLYDYRGIDGTGTKENPVKDKTSSNYVEYKVRRLADGNCWMSESLKLALSTSTTLEVSLFDLDSNGNTQTTAWKPNTGTNYAYDVALNGNTKIVNNVGYYSWYAVTAGQGTQSKSSGDVTASICPKGWRLPSVSGNTSFYNLLISIYRLPQHGNKGGTRNLPWSLTFSGAVSNGTLSGNNDTTSGNGTYITASAYSTTNVYHLYTNLDPSYNGVIYSQETRNVKTTGYAVRCLAIL